MQSPPIADDLQRSIDAMHNEQATRTGVSAARRAGMLTGGLVLVALAALVLAGCCAPPQGLE